MAGEEILVLVVRDSAGALKDLGVEVTPGVWGLRVSSLSGIVALDSATLTALELIGVKGADGSTLASASNPLPASLATADAGLVALRDSLRGASTGTLEALRLILEGRLADDTGTWSYYAGVSGTVAVAAGQRVIGIAAIATGAGASVTINGGAAIPIPANIGVDLAPRGNVVAPTVVFTGTVSYLIEVLV